MDVEREAGGPALAKLRTSNPYLSFAKAIELFYEALKYAPGIHATAVIAKNAKIAAGAHIGPYCFVDEDASIGENAVLHSFVTIYRGARIGANFFAHAHAVVREFCRVGDRVILQNGVIIGGDGLGYAKNPDGTWYKMTQMLLTGFPLQKVLTHQIHIDDFQKGFDLMEAGNCGKVVCSWN